MNTQDLLKEMTSPDRSRNSMLIKKWGKLLEGITNPIVRVNTAKCFENEITHLKSLTEETLKANTGEFLKYIFPVLRRVWPEAI